MRFTRVEHRRRLNRDAATSACAGIRALTTIAVRRSTAIDTASIARDRESDDRTRGAPAIRTARLERGSRCRGGAAGRRMRQSRRPDPFESRPAIAW
jgi:hypothetical protein